MTSNIRRLAASQVLNILGKRLEVKCDSLASKVKIATRKNLLPKLVLPFDEIEKYSSCSLNEDDLSRDIKLHSDNSNAEAGIAIEDRSFCVEIEDGIFIKEVLGGIVNKTTFDLSKSVSFSDEHKETVIVEYSSPNIAKPFHAGHLRSTILGNFIANIYQHVGHKVYRINYLGDWGSQLGVLFKGFQQFGDDEILKRNPLRHLYEVYVKANELVEEDKTFKDATRLEFKNLENGDQNLLNTWKTFLEISKKDLNQTYKDFGVHFDIYEGESQYSEKANFICNELKERGLSRIDEEGAEIYDFDHPGGRRKIVLKKSDGTNLYLTRDIAAAVTRKERYNFTKMFYVVENGQNDHFLSLFDVLKSMKKDWVENLIHVKFGRVLGMSTRSGNAVFLRDILKEAEVKAKAAMENSPNTKVDVVSSNVARVLGASSLIVNDLKSRRQQNVDFSWEKAVQVKGDSGIFLHYVHARLCRLKITCGVDLDENCDLSYIIEPNAMDLIGHLARYEDAIYGAYTSLEPCILVRYLFRLGCPDWRFTSPKREQTPIHTLRLLDQ